MTDEDDGADDGVGDDMKTDDGDQNKKKVSVEASFGDCRCN